MKKIIVMILTCLILLFTLTGCEVKGLGNNNIGWGSYTFNKVHFAIGNKDCCKEISSWSDNEVGIEVKLKDGNVLYLSEGTYMLVKDVCPICAGGI